MNYVLLNTKMKFVNYHPYNAIRITKDNYELINDDNAPFVYKTIDDELVCSLKGSPKCYVGYKDGVLFCNRVRTPINFNTCRFNKGINDLAVYGEVIDEDMEFRSEINFFHEDGNPYDDIHPCKPSCYPVNTAQEPDWDMVDELSDDEIVFLLSLKMDYYETWDPEEDDLYDSRGNYEKYCDVGMTYYCE